MYCTIAKSLRKHYEFVDKLLGTSFPITAGTQRKTFQTIVTETLGMDCDYETVKNIHENLNEMMQERKDNPEPFTLSKSAIKNLLSNSGVTDDKLENFDTAF